ncbi:MAG: EthD family reductase [Candidatus Rokubacteria bacterium]|nr:EthD family reductase [Candidatus Rokubacteria bacterium]
MIKALTFIHRKPGMALDEFQAYWRNEHPKAVMRLPGIRRYVQSHVLPSMYAKGEPAHDGIAEVWADDTDALRAMTKSPAHPALIEDEARFIDRPRMGVLITTEHAALDGKPSGDAVKAVEFFRAKPDMEVDDFQRHWRTTHASLATKVPGLVRYVASMVRPSAYVQGRKFPYDGAALLWFASMENLKVAATSPEYQALIADRPTFLADASPPFLLTREHVIAG